MFIFMLFTAMPSNCLKIALGNAFLFKLKILNNLIAQFYRASKALKFSFE